MRTRSSRLGPVRSPERPHKRGVGVPAHTPCASGIEPMEAARAGHPAMPMGMAEIAVALWKRHLRHNPANPAWANRDRFVLSNGHGSMLLYSLLHLTGYDQPMAELKGFPTVQLNN